jgi:hypothetical protein
MHNSCKSYSGGGQRCWSQSFHLARTLIGKPNRLTVMCLPPHDLVCEVKETFDDLDSQELGTVDTVDAAAMLRSPRFLMESEVQRLVAQMDMDSNWCIDYEEWLTLMISWKKVCSHGRECVCACACACACVCVCMCSHTRMFVPGVGIEWNQPIFPSCCRYSQTGCMALGLSGHACPLPSGTHN